MIGREELARTKRIHRRTGRTFYYATRLLPERVRHPTYVLYAFFRIADEVVDGSPELTPAQRRERLGAIREAALGRRPPDDPALGDDAPVLGAFAAVRERSDIPAAEVEAFVDAMAADTRRDRYGTYDQLRGYMRGSAAAVGAMMTAVMDPDSREAALPRARALGEAFQLTNFLRDVREDVRERDRIYLPRETLSAYGATHDQVADLEFDGRVAAAVERELRRAEGLYREGVAGIRHLPRDCQFPVVLAAVLYAEHHRLIRARGFDVLSATPGLSARRKLWTVGRAWWHWVRTGDPETTFARASAVPSRSARRRAEHREPVAVR